MKRLAPVSLCVVLGLLVGLGVAWSPLRASWDNVRMNGWMEQGLDRLPALALKAPLRLWLKAAAGTTVFCWIVMGLFLRGRVRAPGPALAWVAAALLSGGSLVAANAWASLGAEARDVPRLNVVWIVIDALRADHMSCYGYEKETSPFLDQLAEGGFLFERALSQESYTLASAASYFTSNYPPATGVLYDRPQLDALDWRFATVAEVLKDAGYATAAFVFNPHLQARFNFAQGFDRYDDTHPWYREKDPTPPYERWETGEKMLGKLRPYLDDQAQRPVFLYLHYRDVHGPYVPPPPYHETFLPEGYEPQVDILEHRGRELNWSLEHRDLYVSQYDGEILYTDVAIRNAFDLLAQHGIDLENTVVVVTSDHGEEFLEKHPQDPGGWSHGRTLFLEQLHVPLILHVPEVGAPRRVDTFVELVDIGPTVLDAVGLPLRPELGFRGRSLMSALRGEALEARPVFAGGNRGRGVVVSDDWSLYLWERDVKLNVAKFHDRPEDTASSTYGEELFHLGDDPRQSRDVLDQHEETSQELREVLGEWLTQELLGTGIVREVDAETARVLQQLGYAGDDDLPDDDLPDDDPPDEDPAETE